MPAEINLHSSGDFIDARYSGNVTIADIQYFNNEGVKILDNSTRQKLDSIMDISTVKSHPNNVAHVWRVSTEIMRHQKLGKIVVVGLDNPLTKFLLEIVTTTLGRAQLVVVATREEALKLLTTTE